MSNEEITKALETAKKGSKKRNFAQSVDFLVNLHNLNLKKTDEQVDLFVTLPHGIGRKRKVCAIVGPELFDDAKKVYDKVIHIDDLDSYKDKVRESKKIAREYDYVIAQANIMPRVAAVFGRIFGPKGKMPNPKVGGVVPPKSNVAALYEKLQKTVRLSAKANPVVQVIVGKEDQKAEEVTENIKQVYDNLIHHLPKEKHNVRGTFVKLTMGKPVELKL